MIHIAAPNAPQAPPLKPIPPANPAAITACMSDAPIFCASIAAQLTGGQALRLGFSESVRLISLKAIRRIICRHAKAADEARLLGKTSTPASQSDVFDDAFQFISVISEQLMYLLRSRKDFHKSLCC